MADAVIVISSGEDAPSSERFCSKHAVAEKKKNRETEVEPILISSDDSDVNLINIDDNDIEVINAVQTQRVSGQCLINKLH